MHASNRMNECKYALCIFVYMKNLNMYIRSYICMHEDTFFAIFLFLTGLVI